MAGIHPPKNATNCGGYGGGDEGGLPEKVVPKRQRRPSVRLENMISEVIHARRTTKNDSKFIKNRALTNSREFNGDPKDATLDSVIGTWKVKDSKKRCSKRGRSNNASRVDAGTGDGGCGGSGGGGLVDNGCRDFDGEDLASPEKELSLGRGNDNVGGGDETEMANRRGGVCYNGDGVNLSVPSHTEGRELRGGNGDDGVRIWLNGLGLGRYAPVFEIHEVDNEVLPLLTLEDLKVMGINAVGSRRKMFCAIQKICKGYS